MRAVPPVHEIRVVTADDQKVVREGLCLVLGLIPGVEVVGAAEDGLHAVRLAAELVPDVVLMDLRMPHCDGVEATRRIAASGGPTRVVVLTTFVDDRSVIAAIQAGASGYLSKDAGAEEIREALFRVVAGDAALDPAVQRHLVAVRTTMQIDLPEDIVAFVPEAIDSTGKRPDIVGLDAHGRPRLIIELKFEAKIDVHQVAAYRREQISHFGPDRHESATLLVVPVKRLTKAIVALERITSLLSEAAPEDDLLAGTGFAPWEEWIWEWDRILGRYSAART